MSVEVPPPEVTADAPARRFTADEFLRMCELGIIGEDERVELLDGQIFLMLPPGPWHGDTVAWLTEFFNTRHGGRFVVFPQNTFPAGEYDVALPDLALFRRRRYNKTYPRPEDGFLLIEVAHSSLRLDRKKAITYAQAAIPEYWIVNEKEQVVEVYRSPVAGEYMVKMRIRLGEKLSPELFPDVQLNTAEFFGN